MSDIIASEQLRPEVWLPVVGYEGLYEVSNLGRVRRDPAASVKIGLVSAVRCLNPSMTDGYEHVSLSRRGEVRTHRVHVLVLTAFCGEKPFDGAHGAHNDGDPGNNALTNLRWATPVENQADVDRHGRRCRGEAVFGAVLNEQAVAQIRARIKAGERNPPIAADFGVSISTVHLIRHEKIWRHVA